MTASGQSFYDVSCQWLRDHPERLGLEFQNHSVGWIAFWGLQQMGGEYLRYFLMAKNSCTTHDARNLVNSYQVGRLSATHDRLAEWISVATSCSPGYGIADVAGRSKDLFWSMVLGAAV